MKAAVYTRYGSPQVVSVQEVERPVPRADELLVRVRASTVSAADWRFRKADPFLVRFMNGLTRPRKVRVLGIEFSGRVEQVGDEVRRFKPGDDVFGLAGFGFGAHAQYLRVREKASLEIKPTNMSYEQAAAVAFGGISALHFLRLAGVKTGRRVLIYGASGSVGVFAVQLAKHFGAHVTAVCSTRNLELVKSLGADEAIDYTGEDFSRRGCAWDIVFDAVGKAGFARALKALKPGGVYATAVFAPPLAGLRAKLSGAGRVVSGGAKGEDGDLALLKQLVESGVLKTVIDRAYRMDEIALAHRHAEAGHKRGHVVVVID